MDPHRQQQQHGGGAPPRGPPPHLIPPPSAAAAAANQATQQQPGELAVHPEQLLMMLRERMDKIQHSMQQLRGAKPDLPPERREAQLRQLQHELAMTEQEYMQQRNLMYNMHHNNMQHMHPSPHPNPMQGCASPQQQPPHPQQPQYMDLNQVPVETGKLNTMAWQQQSYMVDSGIHSGHSTNAPSVSSQDSRLSELTDDPSDMAMWEHNYRAHYSNQPGSGPNPGGRLRCASSASAGSSSLFSEAIDEGFVTPPVLDSAADIQKIMPLITDDDLLIAKEAAEIVLECSRHEAKKAAIVQGGPHIVQAVVRLIEQAPDQPDILLLSTSILHNISDLPQGLVAIFKSGGIPVLLGLLQSSEQVILYKAITTLHNLLLSQDATKHAVRQHNLGVHNIVQLLRNPTHNEKFLAIACDCLQLLSFGNTEGKKLILEAGGSAEVLRIMQTYQYEKLLWTASRVIKVLSVCPDNKKLIVQCGGMQTLGGLLSSPSHRLVMNCLWSLRNLSDIATQQMKMEKVVENLTSLLASKDTNAVTIVCCILSNLMCNNSNNKMVCAAAGGVHMLLQIVSAHPDRDDMVEPAVCALRHLVSRHAEAEQAQAALRSANGVAILAQTLHCNKYPIIKATVGLFRNLALSPNNYPQLRQCNVIVTLVGLACQLQTDLQRLSKPEQQQQSSSNSSNGTERKKREELLEGVVGSLQMLARDQTNRQIIRNAHPGPGQPPDSASCLTHFAQMMFSSNHSLVRVSSGVLSELTMDMEPAGRGAQVLREPQLMARLKELQGHSDQSIASHSCGIMFNMAEDGSTEKKHLQQQQKRLNPTPPVQMNPMPPPTPPHVPSPAGPSSNAPSPAAAAVPPRAPIMSQGYQFATGGAPGGATTWNMRPVLDSVPNSPMGGASAHFGIASAPVPASVGGSHAMSGHGTSHLHTPPPSHMPMSPAAQANYMSPPPPGHGSPYVSTSQGHTATHASYYNRGAGQHTMHHQPHVQSHFAPSPFSGFDGPPSTVGSSYDMVDLDFDMPVGLTDFGLPANTNPADFLDLQNCGGGTSMDTGGSGGGGGGNPSSASTQMEFFNP